MVPGGGHEGAPDIELNDVVSIDDRLHHHGIHLLML